MLLLGGTIATQLDSHPVVKEIDNLSAKELLIEKQIDTKVAPAKIVIREEEEHDTTLSPSPSNPSIHLSDESYEVLLAHNLNNENVFTIFKHTAAHDIPLELQAIHTFLHTNSIEYHDIFDKKD